MKCLVLGATGIIGNHIIRELLRDGHEVAALSRGVTPSVNLEDLKIETIKADLQDAASLKMAFRGRDWVFHAAAYYPKNAFGMAEHVAMAMAQTQNVIEAAWQSGIKKLIYTSSLTTIGHSVNGHGPASPERYAAASADETCAYDLFGRDPHPYFRLKHLIEEEFRKEAKGGLPVVMGNPTGIFGPYELKPREMCLVPQLARREIPAYVDRPINVVDAADVARGQILVAQKGKIGERYILGGHNTTSEQLVRDICDVIGVAPPRFKAPLKLALALSYASEVSTLVMGGTPKMPVLGLRFVEFGQNLSSAKAEKELGYSVHAMKPCFERALAWYRKIGYC